jgi:ribosomal protein S18 acetylase RimI-like enzyme
MMPAGPGEILAWDSRFFKMTIGRVKRREIDQVAFRTIRSWASQNAIDCLYFLSRKKQLPFAAQQRGYFFYYLGNRVVLEKNPGAIPVLIRPPEDFTLRPVQISDVDFLVKISRKAFRETRFYKDPHFPEEKCHQLYGTWIKNSCRGMADRVFVACGPKLPVGFITCHLLGPGEGQIGLLAVSEPHRGRGIAEALLSESFDYFKNNGVNRLKVVTQADNRSGLNLYLKMGFKKKTVAYWYHIWRNQ